MADVQTQNALIEAHALARHVRMSPQKARLVMDLIRGQRAQDALQTLKFTQKRAAKHIAKVLLSAIANAERKAEDAGAPLDVDMLFVAQCFVNEGPRWKRLRPAPMGRAFRYQKRTAHLWVGVAEHHVAAAERVAWAWPSIMWQLRNAWQPTWRRPKRKRACAAPRAVFAKL